MDEPAPCPFCGELGVNFVTPETTKWGAAECGSCGALGPDVRTSYDTGPTASWHAEALNEWNRRPEPEILPCYLCADPAKHDRCSTSICGDCADRMVVEREKFTQEHDRLICKIAELERYSPDQHVIPEFPGERQHAASVLCWCQPRRDDEDPRVVIHDRKAEA